MGLVHERRVGERSFVGEFGRLLVAERGEGVSDRVVQAPDLVAAAVELGSKVADRFLNPLRVLAHPCHSEVDLGHIAGAHPVTSSSAQRLWLFERGIGIGTRHFGSGLVGGEHPVDSEPPLWFPLRLPDVDPFGNEPAPVQTFDAAIETLAFEDADLDLNHVEPAGDAWACSGTQAA